MKDKSYVVCRGTGEPVGRTRLFGDGKEIGPERAYGLLRGPHVPFEYGYAGQGPRTLALALLLDALCNAEAAFDSHGPFSAQFLNTASAGLEEVTFTRYQILDWHRGYATGRTA